MPILQELARTIDGNKIESLLVEAVKPDRTHTLEELTSEEFKAKTDLYYTLTYKSKFHVKMAQLGGFMHVGYVR